MFVMIFALGLLPTFAQQSTAGDRFEIAPFVGYHFGGKIRVREGDISIKDNIGYGIMVDIALRPGTKLEILYSHQPSELRLKRYATGIRETLFDASVDYWQIGGLQEFYKQGITQPFAVATLGVTHLNPKSVNASSELRFSFGFGGGAKIMPSEHFGFRLDGRLYLTYIAGGAGFWCGLPGGCWVTMGGEMMAQVQLNAGLIIAF
jgi:hypothetical protein